MIKYLIMTIIWHGQSCFQMTAARNKGEQISILIDPFSEEIGLRLPKLESDILLISHQHRGHNNVKAVSGSPFIINGPGEYEVKNVFIEGIRSWHDDKGGNERGENTIYTIETEDLRLCHLGDFGQKELTGEQLDRIGQIDILMLPVGGIATISAKEALKVMSQLEPKIVIPMHYRIPKLNPSVCGKLDGLDIFLKTVGIKSIEPQNKLLIKKKEISSEEVKIIALKP